MSNVIGLNVGYSFDFDIIPMLDRLSTMYRENGIVINEVYGSLLNGPLFKTARPNGRLPKVDILDLEKHVQLLNSFGICFNYVLNASPTYLWYSMTDDEIKRIIDTLLGLGVKYITISNMYLLHRVVEYAYKSHIEQPFIVLSTIMEIDNFDTIDFYIGKSSSIRPVVKRAFLTRTPLEDKLLITHIGQYSKYVDKIILSIYSNRDFILLNQLKKFGLSHKVELLVNEFCTIAGMPCMLRKMCYELHSISVKSAKDLVMNFPFGWCSQSRDRFPDSYLKAPVIFPWDIGTYESEFGINKFKLSGRTLPTEFILKTTEAYMSLGKRMDDNILALWGHVNRIGTDDLMKLPEIYISAKKLKGIGFITPLMERQGSCKQLSCVSCNYCERVYEATKGEL